MTAFLATYCLAAGLALLLFGTYKSIGTLSGAFPNLGAVAVALGTLSSAVSGLCLTLIVRRSSAAARDRRRIAVSSTAALLSLLVMALLAETMLRALAQASPDGVRIGRIQLPRTWSEERQRLAEIVAKATPSGRWEERYFVFDAYLGWTVGPGRISADGLYASSAEGLRSRERGERLADRIAPYRVALVGDSYAFSLDVPFEESWGHHLEERLGPDYQVLNFGVDGYGVDQVTLRVERDVSRFQPDVVLFALNQDDLYRSMGVYAFITNPAWSLPFAKPRFVLNPEGGLVHLNRHLPSPHQLIGVTEVNRLPHVELDLGYQRDDWAWRAGSPYVFRLLTSLSPRYPQLDPALGFDGTVRLNAALLRRLFDASVRMGAAFVGVYLPSRDPDEHLARATITASGLTIEPMHSCLARVPPERLRVESGGSHFSGEANLYLAECSAALIEGRTLHAS